MLGRPGAGCTTLLNTLAGTPDKNLRIDVCCAVLLL